MVIINEDEQPDLNEFKEHERALLERMIHADIDFVLLVSSQNLRFLGIGKSRKIWVSTRSIEYHSLKLLALLRFLLGMKTDRSPEIGFDSLLTTM